MSSAWKLQVTHSAVAPFTCAAMSACAAAIFSSSPDTRPVMGSELTVILIGSLPQLLDLLQDVFGIGLWQGLPGEFSGFVEGYDFYLRVVRCVHENNQICVEKSPPYLRFLDV